MLPKGRYPDSAETTVLDQQLYSRPQVYSIKPLSGHCQAPLPQWKWPLPPWVTSTGCTRCTAERYAQSVRIHLA